MNLCVYPYPSCRRVVVGEGLVATSQPLAAQAGAFVLREGGSAVDAALAAAAVLTVVEPTSNGLGGDAFALVWHGGRLTGLASTGAWPASASPERLRAGGAREVPELGWPAVTVPGAPAAWQALHERFGRLPLSRVLEPALRYAEQGFFVSPVVARFWEPAVRRFAALREPLRAGFLQTFAPAGAAPAAGERFVCPGHAATLRRFREVGIQDFYTGSIAAALCSYAERTGGSLSASDLASHRPEWVEPLRISYRGYDVWQLPPSCPGVTTLEALGILEGFDLANLPHAGEAAWHLQIEALKGALADTFQRVADPRAMPEGLEVVLSADHLAARRAAIGERASDPGPPARERGGTVYLCAADREGSMVSFIQSNYMGFGSGLVEPSYGVALHNRGACFSLQRGHVNEAQPGKRPRHTLMPGFVTRAGEAVAALGVMGGEMQPQGQLQVISSLLDHQLNPQAALDAPRFRAMQGRCVWVEAAADPAVVSALRARGHEVREISELGHFGRGQIILRLPGGGYAGGTEPRADGGIAVL